MPSDSPSPAAILDAVQSRYTALAEGSDSLSCGDALGVAAPLTGEVMVDLGCGRGRDVLRAAAQVGTAGQVIGVDASGAMLEQARSSVPSHLVNVRFANCELTALDLDDGIADVVISNCAINHASDKSAVYREIRRILKPGGRFVVADVVCDSELPETVRNDPEAWAACYGGAIPLGEYLAAIEGAGLVRLEVLRRTAPYSKGEALVRSITVRGYRS
jgi:arsenite methyltransferase